jgi:regulator-associated protein of mTOR
MAFHAYDNHLIVANEHDMIRFVSCLSVDNLFLIHFSVFDWSTRKRLNYFCNGNPKGTSITALEIINQDVGGIILTGSGKLLSCAFW